MTDNDWYRDFYLTTKDGEAELRNAMLDPDNLSAVKKRLAEMKSIAHGEVDKRCAITTDQIRFLERVLGSL